MIGITLLAATLATAAAPVSAQERVLSVNEAVAGALHFNGQTIQVRGFLVRDIARRPRAELLSSTLVFKFGSQLLGIAQDVPIARDLARHLGREVVITGKFDSACFAPNVTCIHGRRDLTPIHFRIVEDR